MPRVARVVPELTDLLCEKCGYTLNGLPLEGNCPECGEPIASSVGDHRRPSDFEARPSAATFLRTTVSVLIAPRRFYRTLATRLPNDSARMFASIHRVFAAVLFSSAVLGHGSWAFPAMRYEPSSYAALPLVVFVPLCFILFGVTRLATFLSAIEARYWGMRLPYAVVERGLAFHAADYVPVGIVANVVIWGYRALLDRGILTRANDTIYLYTLCGLVIVSAIYLFQTYWIGMRSMMYANR